MRRADVLATSLRLPLISCNTEAIYNLRIRPGAQVDDLLYQILISKIGRSGLSL